VTPGVNVSKLLPEMGVYDFVCQLRKVKGKCDKAVIIKQCHRKLRQIKLYVLLRYLLSQQLSVSHITNIWSIVLGKVTFTSPFVY
jgi:hypothetical protein